MNKKTQNIILEPAERIYSCRNDRLRTVEGGGKMDPNKPAVDEEEAEEEESLGPKI